MVYTRRRRRRGPRCSNNNYFVCTYIYVFRTALYGSHDNTHNTDTHIPHYIIILHHPAAAASTVLSCRQFTLFSIIHTHTHVICPGTTRAFHRVFTFFLSLRPPTPSRQTLTIYACTHTKPRHTKSLRRRIHAHFIQTGPAMTTHYYKCPFTKKENIGTSTTSAGPPPRGLQIVFESERATENTARTYNTYIYIYIYRFDRTTL